MKFLKTVVVFISLTFSVQAQEDFVATEPVAGFTTPEIVLLKTEEITEVFKTDQSFTSSISKIDSSDYLQREEIRAEIDSLENLLTIKNEDSTLQFVPPEEFTFAGQRRYTLYGDLPLAKTKIKPIQTAVVWAGYSVLIYSLHKAQSVWWTDNAEFKIIEDWDFAIQADKAGHAFGGYFASYLTHEVLLSCGFNRDASIWAGGILGFGYQSYVETLDGFANGWGFSFSDEFANAVGAGLFIAQNYVPYLQNFQPKWQYISADWSGERPRKNATVAGNFIDDYNSNTFWLSINVNNMLSESAEQYWPDWLMLSIGYGARNIETGYDDERARRVMIGLDYNLVELLPDGPNWWNWTKQTLNHFKLPAPTLEFSRGITTFRILYPFQIRL